MKVVYYTSGTPGTGRIVWGISIFNAFARRGIDCDFSIVSSTPQDRLADLFGILHIEIPPEDRNSLRKPYYEDSEVYKALCDLDPDILLVDRMWFTLHDFVERLPGKKMFFTIQVRDEFFRMELPGEILEFNPAGYKKVLAIEPFKSCIDLELINPLVVRNRDEILDRNTALEDLGVSGDRDVYLCALNFKDGYFEKLKDKYAYLEKQDVDVIFIYTTNVKGGGIFPIVDYLNAVDVIICAAGYTQFWRPYIFKRTRFMKPFPCTSRT